MNTYSPPHLETITEPLYLSKHPIQTQKGPLVKSYVDTAFTLLRSVVNSQAKTYIVLVTVNFPAHWSLERRLSKNFYTKMIEALKSQMKAFDNRAVKNGIYRTNDLKYLRAVEVGYQNGGLHAHFAFFFNGHVFNSLGDQNSGLINMRYRLHQAWASALRDELKKDGLLGVPEDVKGLVHFSSDYLVVRNGGDEANKVLNSAFYHITYLCKLATKEYRLPVIPFVSSGF